MQRAQRPDPVMLPRPGGSVLICRTYGKLKTFFSQITLKLAEKKTLSEEISTVVFQQMCMDCRLSSKLVSPSANVFTKYRALSSTHPYYTLQNLRLCKEQIGQHSVMRDLNGQTAYQVPRVNSPTTHCIKTSLIKSQLPPPY